MEKGQRSPPSGHPNATTPRGKAISQTARLLKKLEKQFVRFHKMSTDQKMGYLKGNQFASFCTIESTRGGGLLYGLEGDSYFNELCEVIAKFSPDLKGKVGFDVAKKVVKDEFRQQFMINSVALDKAGAELYLEAVVAALKSKCKKIVHNIPCIFFTGDSPDSFSVGPVSFIRMSVFLDGCQKSFKKYDWFDEDRRELVSSLEGRALDYYQKFPWIASVEINQCDFEISYKQAVFACQTALNVVKVMFGATHTNRFRLSTAERGASNSARIWSVKGEEYECALSSSVASPHGPTNWYDYLNKDDGLYVKRFLGDVIEVSNGFFPHTELSARLVDSINWFGDAVTESSDAAAIVKYVTAIERLYFGVQCQGMRKKFSSRIQRVLKDLEYEGEGKVFESASDVYKVRSTLVHGAISPSLGEVILPLSKAEDLARRCIISSVQIYALIHEVFRPANAADFEAGMLKYEAEGIEWLSIMAAKLQSDRMERAEKVIPE
ncbi:HEPN domain-containing protein [Pseudomonas sp. W15Feb34]|uniref:HEPN domain-containing protein n=1 Tax=Pseudomonas sp. W15Feb34 TaxID=550727 RepID=UPI00200355BD|nr:HEPN domain-containing protein [Pseudomonas sp. W15Feb34]MCK3846624.1 hypothetical protein [Pseudomonas sp. W15Feb34]